MRITFQHSTPPLEDTQQFEDVYPEKLQVDLDEKAKVLHDGWAVWLLVDVELAGEMYGLPAVNDDEGIPDLLPKDFYLGSFTILPRYQGKGLGRVLFAYILAMIRTLILDGDKAFSRISWHATSWGMTSISDFFGAKIGPTHQNWFDTGKPATFRYLDL